jgi:hypothetical protein
LFAQEIVTLNGKDYKNISLSEFSFLNASGQLKLGETFVIDAYHSGMIGADFGLMEKDLSANTLFKIKSFVKFDFETPVRAFVEVTKVDAQYPGIMNETTIIKVDKRLE